MFATHNAASICLFSITNGSYANVELLHEPWSPHGSIYLLCVPVITTNLWSRTFSLTLLWSNNNVMHYVSFWWGDSKVCVCVCVCVYIDTCPSRVSETSSARYLCLSLKAITSLPLLAKTTGAGQVPPSSLTNLSAWRASREGEREREKIPERFHLSRELSSPGYVRGHTYHKFHNSWRQRKLTL